MKYLQASLIAILLSITSLSFAGGQQIPCPSAEVIKNAVQYVDTITNVDQNIFEVYTHGDLVSDGVSNRLWSVDSAEVTAPDFNAAFNLGKINIKNVVKPVKPYADGDGPYLCLYVDLNGGAIAYASSDPTPSEQYQHDRDIRKALLNSRR